MYSLRIDPSAAFYLSTSRFWELLVGSMLAFGNGTKYQMNRLSNQFGSLLGLSVVVLAIVAYDSSMTFPGYAAVVPVLGAALVIHCAQPGTLVAWLLSSRPLVGIGLLSYSIYLWHQPLFAFARIEQPEPEKGILLSLAVGSVILAYFSWRFIERPFRRQEFIPGCSKFAFSAVVIAAVAIGFGCFLHFSKGVPQRMGSVAMELLSFSDYPQRRQASAWKDCFFWPPHANFSGFPIACLGDQKSSGFKRVLWGG